jgi:hypothetical protein
VVFQYEGLGVGPTTPHLKKISTLRNVTKGLGLGKNLWINDLIWLRIGTSEELL